jgi:hypothetical protein
LFAVTRSIRVHRSSNVGASLLAKAFFLLVNI